MAAGRKEKETLKKQNWEREAQRGRNDGSTVRSQQPKDIHLIICASRRDLITHKVIKSIVFALCPVSSNRWVRNLQLHSCSLGLPAQGAFTSHSLQPKWAAREPRRAEQCHSHCWHSYFLLHEPQSSKAVQEEDMGTRLSGHLITADGRGSSKAADGRGYGWFALHWYHLDLENSLSWACVFYWVAKKKNTLDFSAVLYKHCWWEVQGWQMPAEWGRAFLHVLQMGLGCHMPSLPALLQLAILPGFGKQQEIPFPWLNE